jgi:hypothetical protein
VRFQESADCRVLVSSDAGGYGVDLPQANLLINYDLPWGGGLAVQRNCWISPDWFRADAQLGQRVTISRGHGLPRARCLQLPR